MTWIRINISYSALFLLLFSSCYSSKDVTYKEKIAAYSTSTNSVFLERYFVSLPVSIGKEEDAGVIIDKQEGFVIIRGITLYHLLFNDTYSLSNYSNYVFNLLVRKKELLVTVEQFEKLKEFLISREDGNKYALISTTKIIKEKSKDMFLPDVDNNTPNYNDRCILHNLLNNGYTVRIDDESGYLIYQKSEISE